MRQNINGWERRKWAWAYVQIKPSLTAKRSVIPNWTFPTPSLNTFYTWLIKWMLNGISTSNWGTINFASLLPDLNLIWRSSPLVNLQVDFNEPALHHWTDFLHDKGLAIFEIFSTYFISYFKKFMLRTMWCMSESEPFHRRFFACLSKSTAPDSET